MLSSSSAGSSDAVPSLETPRATTGGLRGGGGRGNPVQLPGDFLVLPESVRRRREAPVRAVPVVDAKLPLLEEEEFKEEPLGGEESPSRQKPREEASSLPISCAEKTLAVMEGALFRARIKSSEDEGLGVTVKSTSDGRFVVHALPSATGERGRAEAAGIRVGDLVVGAYDELFDAKATLAELVERIKRAQAERMDVILVLKRGSASKARQNEMASILLAHGVIDDGQASVLTSMMSHLEARLEDWDARGDLLAGTDRCANKRRRRRRQAQQDEADVGARMGRWDKQSSSSSKRRGIRPALCVRILGTDYVEDHTVYVIWVLDVLAGAEWRVQRRFREFFELHDRLVSLRPSMDKLDFPMRRPSIYETVHSVNDRRVRLERHLRRVAGMLFSSRLHEQSSAVALALEAFLEVPKRRASLELLERNPDVRLRQAVQVAVYQLLALPVFEKIVGDIVHALLAADFESGADLLLKMKAYIDHLQQCVFDGAAGLFRAVALRRQPRIPEDDLAAVASNAVRRQIETDIFVPLMDKLHALLAADIADLDATLHFKCQAARSRPQSFFGIPLHHISPSSWESAIYQLSNIGSYTLPCDKLDALLAAAKEIPQLFLAEHPGTSAHLGADDFLPIFIYVLVNSDIPNLAYLQRVLCTLCDPDKKLSETGYYVATFEAAVHHISELEL